MIEFLSDAISEFDDVISVEQNTQHVGGSRASLSLYL